MCAFVCACTGVSSTRRFKQVGDRVRHFSLRPGFREAYEVSFAEYFAGILEGEKEGERETER